MEIATAHVDVEKLEARAKELLTAIIRGQPTIYTDMLRAEWRAVDAAITSAWTIAYFKEYMRDTGFMSSPIRKYNLQPSETVAIPLITRIRKGDPSQVLDGTEEDLSVYNCALSVDWRRPGRTPH